jgi:hypothetical protein
MQHLEGSGTPILYIGHTVLKSEIWAVVIVSEKKEPKIHAL